MFSSFPFLSPFFHFIKNAHLDVGAVEPRGKDGRTVQHHAGKVVDLGRKRLVKPLWERVVQEVLLHAVTVTLYERKEGWGEQNKHK